jgi:hypothetical protein
VQIGESNFEELNEAALEVTEQSVVVINLEDGRAWYKTRLFAVAATAEILHAPRALVLVGLRGGQPMQVAGWVRPRDFVKAVIRSDRGYGAVWQRAQSYLYRLQSQTDQQSIRFGYQQAFQQVGAASILFILVDQMRSPDQMPAPALPTLEPHDAPPWITLAEVEVMLDPWLVRGSLDLSKPQDEQVTAIMAATGEIVVATREGQYAGLIDVARAERALLRQLLVRPASA